MAKKKLDIDLPTKFKVCDICGNPMKVVYPEDFLDNVYKCIDCGNYERFIRKEIVGD